MSIRAYKVIEIKLALHSTFNLWNCHEGLIESLGCLEQTSEDGTGHLIVEKSFLLERIKKCTDLQLLEELKQVLNDFAENEEYVDYSCF